MKVTVIGGGSTYTPELVSGFLARSDGLPIAELCLMDLDPARLDVVGGFARRMAEARGSPFRITMTSELRRAVAGASYVIAQIRVGMMAARRGDEYLGRRHGLIGQETTGIGGLAKALRTVPVMLDVAREVHESAPSALLLNFTNPAGLVTEALARHAPDVAVVGVCNSGITTKMGMLAQVKELLGREVDPARAELETLGLNHLTWYRGFRVEGDDVWPRLFAAFLERLARSEKPRWDPVRIEALGMIPNSYLQYYYRTERKLAEQESWPPSRAEEVMAIEETLLREYADPALTTLPGKLMERGGAWYSTLATDLIAAHHNDLGDVHIVNIRHDGAVRGWPAEWIVEMPARIDGEGIHPLAAEPLPGECFDLVSRVKRSELLTVEAAVHGDRDALREALVAHPLGPEADRAPALLDDLLATNRQWLPRFATQGVESGS